MKFQKLRLQNIEELQPYFTSNEERICNLTIGSAFMWRDMCETEFAIEDETLFLKGSNYLPGVPAFAQPKSLNPDLDMAAQLAKIETYCRDAGLPPRLSAVSGGFLETVRRLYPGATETTDAAWSDYLYNATDLSELAGRRYSGQRNHINRFQKQYENWRFEPVGEQNISRVRQFFEIFSTERARDDIAYAEGNAKALEVIDHLELYKQLGGALFVGDEIVGAAFGEICGDTLFVHTEKALTEYHGAYPMLVQQFSRYFTTGAVAEAYGEVKFINREEDDGVEGLRVSKQSYHPCALLEKYNIELERRQ
ncbi:MAG: phosphatidylglycerol lysyltransferase domain-containing protein [Oscillospiraceae bacterium]|nr:phosphatidylglycerol lysyltransferase domain-containing protein [Oscillospiraceae bacterium]